MAARDSELEAARARHEELSRTVRELQEEKQAANERLDSVITVTQRDRVDSTLHRLEQESLIKQVEHLKLSESKLKR